MVAAQRERTRRFGSAQERIKSEGGLVFLWILREIRNRPSAVRLGRMPCREILSAARLTMRGSHGMKTPDEHGIPEGQQLVERLPEAV